MIGAALYIAASSALLCGTMALSFVSAFRINDNSATGFVLAAVGAVFVGFAGLFCATEGGRLLAHDENVAVVCGDRTAQLEERSGVGDAATGENAAGGEPHDRLHGRRDAAHCPCVDANSAQSAVVEDDRKRVRIDISIAWRHAVEDVAATVADAPASAKADEGDAHGGNAEVDNLDGEGRDAISIFRHGTEPDGDALSVLQKRPDGGEKAAENANDAAGNADPERGLLQVHAPSVPRAAEGDHALPILPAAANTPKPLCMGQDGVVAAGFSSPSRSVRHGDRLGKRK